MSKDPFSIHMYRFHLRTAVIGLTTMDPCNHTITTLFNAEGGVATAGRCGRYIFDWNMGPLYPEKCVTILLILK